MKLSSYVLENLLVPVRDHHDEDHDEG